MTFILLDLLTSILLQTSKICPTIPINCRGEISVNVYILTVHKITFFGCIVTQQNHLSENVRFTILRIKYYSFYLVFDSNLLLTECQIFYCQ